MSRDRQEAFIDLVLETFRLSSRLLASGDALVADIGLTSARWQVLGALALSPVSLPVAHIARNMGLTRQAVQRLVNEMQRDGLVSFRVNPHHQRAKLVILTSKGKSAYDAAMKRQRPWAANLTSVLGTAQIENTAAALRALRERLDERTSTR